MRALLSTFTTRFSPRCKFLRINHTWKFPLGARNPEISDNLEINGVENIRASGPNNTPTFVSNKNLPSPYLKGMVIKKINKQSIGFCYGVEDNDVNLKECELKNNYTIRPVVISDRMPMVDIKEKLDSGSLLSLSINSTLKKELPSILIYIKSKNYIITNLEENVLE